MQDGFGDWPFLTGLGLGAPASVQGAFYSIPGARGWYPALIPTQARFASAVHGTLHEIGEVDLAAIDAFEGADYARQSLPVDGWDGFGETQADVYVWTADLPPGAEPIASGNFSEWLEETGREAFSPSPSPRT